MSTHCLHGKALADNDCGRCMLNGTRTHRGASRPGDDRCTDEDCRCHFERHMAELQETVQRELAKRNDRPRVHKYHGNGNRCGTTAKSATYNNAEVTCRICMFHILADSQPWAREFMDQLRGRQTYTVDSESRQWPAVSWRGQHD